MAQKRTIMTTMNMKRHLRIVFAYILCLFVRRMSAISVAGRGPPLDSILWSFKERFTNIPQRYSTIDHFRSFSCNGRTDQLYPDLSSGCRNFYRCLKGVPYSNSCSSGKLFDMKSQDCRNDDDVDCPLVPPSTEKCWHQPDGFYPDYDSRCTSYYSCYNGSLDEEGKCEGRSIWDSATGSCGFGQHVSCNPPSCMGLREGFYPLKGSACTAYYSCSEGYRTDMLCPLGSLFDYMRKQCVSGPEVVCYEHACDGRTNGRHSVPHAECGTFYECFNGVMVELKECPFGQIFDGQKCVFGSNFSCWREGEGSCERKPNGKYAAEDSDCRGFFVCKNRKLIRSFKCDSGLMFNGESCVDSRNYFCNPKPRIPDCSRKYDGYYTVEKTNCKEFYRCRNGKKLSAHTCPGNHVFNGHHCVNPVYYSCSTEGTGIERNFPSNGVYYNGKDY